MEKHEIVSLLATLGRPETGGEWHDYTAFGFSTADAPVLVSLAIDDSFFDAGEDVPESWAPVHAWRSLKHLMPTGLDQLISTFNQLADDDWAMSDFPQICVAAGEAAVEPLFAFWQDADNDEFARSMAMESIAEIGKADTGLRSLAIEKLIAALAEEDIDWINGILVSELLDLKAVEAIDTMRAAYDEERVDMTVCGDMEDVEIALGLRAERETSRPNFFQMKHPELYKNLDETYPGWNDVDDDDYGYSGRFVEPVQQIIRTEPKVGRNDPCPCGSGKKYKKCCMP